MGLGQQPKNFLYPLLFFTAQQKLMWSGFTAPYSPRANGNIIIGVTNTWVSWPKLFHSPTCSPRPLSARAQLCSLPICQMPHLLVSHSLSLSPQLLSFDTIFRHMTCNGERWSAGKVGPEQKQYWVYGPWSIAADGATLGWLMSLASYLVDSELFVLGKFGFLICKSCKPWSARSLGLAYA